MFRPLGQARACFVTSNIVSSRKVVVIVTCAPDSASNRASRSHASTGSGILHGSRTRSQSTGTINRRKLDGPQFGSLWVDSRRFGIFRVIRNSTNIGYIPRKQKYQKTIGFYSIFDVWGVPK